MIKLLGSTVITIYKETIKAAKKLIHRIKKFLKNAIQGSKELKVLINDIPVISQTKEVTRVNS